MEHPLLHKLFSHILHEKNISHMNILSYGTQEEYSYRVYMNITYIIWISVIEGFGVSL